MLDITGSNPKPLITITVSLAILIVYGLIEIGDFTRNSLVCLSIPDTIDIPINLTGHNVESK